MSATKPDASVTVRVGGGPPGARSLRQSGYAFGQLSSTFSAQGSQALSRATSVKNMKGMVEAAKSGVGAPTPSGSAGSAHSTDPVKAGGTSHGHYTGKKMDMREPTLWANLTCHLHEHAHEWFLGFLFFGGVIATWGTAFIRWRGHKELFDVFGYGMVTARSGAYMLNVTCAVVLFPMLRKTLTWMRGSVSSWSVKRAIDEHTLYHMIVGYTCFFCAVQHSISHFYNSFFAGQMTPEKAAQAHLGFPIPTQVFSYKSYSGTTGHIMDACFIVIFATALPSVRTRYYHLFYCGHLFYIPFYFCIFLHGNAHVTENNKFWVFCLVPGLIFLFERIVRVIQMTQIVHCSAIKIHPGRTIELRWPKGDFDYMTGQYLFLCIPQITNFEWHAFTISSSPNDAFVSLHIICVGDWTNALLELCAGTDTGYAIVEVVSVGGPDQKPGEDQMHIGRIVKASDLAMRLDGPFSAPTQSWCQYEVIVMVGAGVGVTPFSSVLRTIWHDLRRKAGVAVSSSGAGIQADVDYESQIRELKKVYFFWSARKAEAFSWVMDMLDDINELAPEGFLELNTFLTGKIEDVKEDEIDGVKGVKNMRRVAARKHQGARKGGLLDGFFGGGSRTSTGSGSSQTSLRTAEVAVDGQEVEDDGDVEDSAIGINHLGRPVWNEIFGIIHGNHKTDVGVFLCGPKALEHSVGLECAAWSRQPKADGTYLNFDYFPEVFG